MIQIETYNKFFNKESDWQLFKMIKTEIFELDKVKSEYRKIKTANIKKEFWRNVLILDSDNEVDDIVLKSNILNTLKQDEWWNCMYYTAYIAMWLIERMKLDPVNFNTAHYKVIEWYFTYKNAQWKSEKNQHTWIIDINNNIYDYTLFQFKRCSDLNNWEYSKPKNIYSPEDYIKRLKKYPLEFYYSESKECYSNWLKWWSQEVIDKFVEYWIWKVLKTA